MASASEDFTIKLWSTNGTLLRTLNTAPFPATSLALSPDGTKLVAGTYFGGFAWGNIGKPGYSSIPGLGLVYLWQAPDGWTSGNVGLVRVYTNKSGKITSMTFSADSLRFAWGNPAGSNYVCSTTSASVLAGRPGYNTSIRPAAVTSVALSSRSALLLAHTATEYVRAHLDGDLSVEQIAGQCGVGSTHFSNTFRQVTGLTPHRYVRRLRIERACDLLRTTALGIGEIAAAVGFAGQSHFCMAFRAERGMTPSAYRRHCMEAARSTVR